MCSSDLQIPVVKTMMGISLMPTDHPLNMGMIGAHGNHCANKALAKSDLLIMVGTRAADRAIVQPDEIQRRMATIDENKLTRLAYMKMVKKAYRNICTHYGEKTRKISSLMRELAQEEKRQNQDIDRMAGLFGEIMAEMMAPKNDEWSGSLRSIGNNLGKFIYILDAYEDIVEDMKKGRFNPLKKRYEDPEAAATVFLSMPATEWFRSATYRFTIKTVTPRFVKSSTSSMPQIKEKK